MTKEKIIILGATGKLGNATLKKLIKTNKYQITQFSRNTTKK